MQYIKAFLAFWYDFIVGDDWLIAAGVVLALVATDRLTRSGVTAWWVVPISVVGLLGVSTWRLARRK